MSRCLAERFAQLSPRPIALAAGETLFRCGDRVARVFLVTDGAVRLERATHAGVRLILQRAVAGEIVAEASCFAARYHCDAVAASSSRLAYVPLKRFRQACALDPALLSAFAQHLAAQVQEARARAEILALKTVASRLDAWLSLRDGALPQKGQWRDLADALAVTPEALYRELASRRR
ncbi:Crp/Fnr family transcriptional regulator [Rhodomicrobium vannielii]|nr:Crp/Fnr family transcriptional regulator [Rhodomicrobium vannielii]